MRQIFLRWTSVLLVPALSACPGGGGGGGGGGGSSPGSPPSTTALNLMNAANWEIGPIIGSRNHSVGMPLHPSPHPDGWAIDLPQPNNTVGHVHYVTARYGSLAGKTRMVMRFRIEAAPDVKIVPTNFPNNISVLTQYFQRKGDDWSGDGKYETYRWWATFNSALLAPGAFELAARFDERWTAVQTSTAFSKQSEFQAALNNADRIGFTFGGGDGYGHGVYATGPARLVVTDFIVE